MNNYRLIGKEEVSKVKRDSNGARISPNGTPLFNDGDHHVIELSESAYDTVVIFLPNGNAVTIAVMNNICDISVYSGEKPTKAKMFGIDPDKKTECLEGFSIYSLSIESKTKLHEFEPTDSSGHSMECLDCGRAISFYNTDDWDKSFREECKGDSL